MVIIYLLSAANVYIGSSKRTHERIMVSLQVYFVNLVKALVVVTLSIIFIFTSWDTWIKYQSKITTTGIRYLKDRDGNGIVPDVSICPFSGFKYAQSFISLTSTRI
jgi:hypothetical protein